jgi:tetratricopeptide (TPR) repeat protein
MAVVVACYLYHNRRELFFWYMLFFIGLLPVSQIVPLVTFMNDRYLYFPMVGAAVFAAALPAGLLSREKYVPRVVGMLLTLMLLTLPYLSLKQSEVWRDSVSLWTHAVKEVPENGIARRILAEALYLRGVDRNNEGESEEALKLYLQALEYDPSSRDILTSIAACYEIRGNEEEARRYNSRINKLP